MYSSNDIMEKCVLPDLLKEDIDEYFMLPQSPYAIKTWSAMVHLYEALYDAIKSGRYNLSLSFKSSFEDVFRIDGEDDKFLISQFLSSALMHYNSAFDIFLECFWVGMGLYRYIKNGELLSLNSNQEVEKVLSYCSYKNVIDTLNKTDDSFVEKLKMLRNKQQIIANWTNNLKHRGNLIIEEFFEEPINIKTVDSQGRDVFDSSKIQTKESIVFISHSLIEYHTALVEHVGYLYDFYRNKVFQTAMKSQYIKFSKT